MEGTGGRRGMRRSSTDSRSLAMGPVPPGTTPRLSLGESPRPPSLLRRESSFFTRRTSAFPSKSDKRPIAIQMYSFYRELKQVCSLKRSTAHCACVSCGASRTLEREEEEHVAGFEWLQLLVQDENLEELQFQLYLREIQRLNPSLEDGCLFVDGLYELVCSRMPMDARANLSQSRFGDARDLLSVHSSGRLLLQQYWRRPQDPDELAPYLTVGASFVRYVLSTWGPEGVSHFLQMLDPSVTDPQAANFKFRGKDILDLELKWKRFVEAQVNERFRLSTPRMLAILFRRYLMKYMFSIFIVFVIILADVALHLYYSIASVKLMSFGFTETSILRIVKWIGILLATIIVRFILMNLSIILQASMAVKVSTKLRRQLSIRLHNVTPKFLSDNSSSSILSTFVQDVNSIEVVVAYGIRAALWGILMLITLIVYATTIVWPIGVALAVIFVVNQILVYFISTRLSNHSFAKSQATSKLTDILKEEVDGFAVNRLYRLGAHWQEQLNMVIQIHFATKARKSLFLTKWIVLFQQTVPTVTAALLVFGIILMIQKDWINFENGLAIFIFYSTVVVSMMSALAAIPQVQNAAIALGRINALLNNPAHTWHDEDEKEEEEDEKDVAESLPVELRNVSFCYEASASHWNLYDVSLRINSGERVAIVGKNGSGKSTLLSLVLQMYKPVHGEIIIGKRGIKKCGKVAATFQTNHMFNVTIRENIRLGRLEASDEDVEEAAKLADIHAWIMSCPRGYDTVVQSGGKSLSGGQRQRIAIARMLVTKAPVLILDEVTSALDPLTESRVFQRMMEATEGKTVIAVTHRLTQMSEFDRIIVLSHGRVKESGTHDQLLALRGTYWRMCNNETAESPDKPVPVVRQSLSTPALNQSNTLGLSTFRRSSLGQLQSGILRASSTPILTQNQHPCRSLGKFTPKDTPKGTTPKQPINHLPKNQPDVHLSAPNLMRRNSKTVPYSTPLHTVEEVRESSRESSRLTASCGSSHQVTPSVGETTNPQGTVHDGTTIRPLNTSTPKDDYVLQSRNDAPPPPPDCSLDPNTVLSQTVLPLEPVVVVVTGENGDKPVAISRNNELTSDIDITKYKV